MSLKIGSYMDRYFASKEQNNGALMRKHYNNLPDFDTNGGARLDKLAQLRKAPTINELRASENSLKSKNNRKYFTKALNFKLQNLDSPLKNYYSRATGCNDILYQHENQLKAKYCNCRTCIVCNSIRTAKAINGYMPVLEKMKDPYFVTLTVPNVKADELNMTVINMLYSFKKIIDLIRKQSEKSINPYVSEIKFTRTKKQIAWKWAEMMVKQIREKEYERYIHRYTAEERRQYLLEKNKNIITPVNAIRKLEITYSIQRNDFHPHYHIIVDTKEKAAQLIDLWLKYQLGARSMAQNMTKANKGSMMELFKYTTKIISNNPLNLKQSRKIELYAIDTIMQVLYKKRTFQTYGNIRRVSEDVEKIQSMSYLHLTPTDSIITWYFYNSVKTWVNPETGECLTDYKPSEFIESVLKKAAATHYFRITGRKLQ